MNAASSNARGHDPDAEELLAQLRAWSAETVRTAVHEAAHAVVCRALGWEVVHLRLEPAPQMQPRILSDHRTVQTARDCIVLAAAGFAGEELLGHDLPTTMTSYAEALGGRYGIPEGDVRQMHENAERLVGMTAAAEVLQGEMNVGIARAQRIVQCNWCGVLKLALAALRFTDQLQTMAITKEESTNENHESRRRSRSTEPQLNIRSARAARPH